MNTIWFLISGLPLWFWIVAGMVLAAFAVSIFSCLCAAGREDRWLETHQPTDPDEADRINRMHRIQKAGPAPSNSGKFCNSVSPSPGQLTRTLRKL